MSSLKSGVKVILVNAQGELLLLHRDVQAPTAPNKWCFVGGAIEPDETAEAAALRETVEEVGYLPVSLSLVGVLSHPSVSATVTVFTASLDAIIDDLTLGEGDDLRFVPVQDAKQMDIDILSRLSLELYLRQTGVATQNP